MVTITSPKSKFLSIDDSSNRNLSWTHEPGQIGYEFLFREKGNSAWSTSGFLDVPEPSTIDIYTILMWFLQANPTLFIEYEYKIISYIDNTNLIGKDSSDVYSVIFHPAYATETLNTYYDSSTHTYPLYPQDDIPDTNISMNFNTDGTIVSALVVDKDSPLASDMFVRIDNENKSIANSYGNFAAEYRDGNFHGEWNKANYSNYSNYYSYYTTYLKDVYYYYTFISSYYYSRHQDSYIYYYFSGPYEEYSSYSYYLRYRTDGPYEYITSYYKYSYLYGFTSWGYLPNGRQYVYGGAATGYGYKPNYGYYWEHAYTWTVYNKFYSYAEEWNEHDYTYYEKHANIVSVYDGYWGTSTYNQLHEYTYNAPGLNGTYSNKYYTINPARP